MGKPIYFLEVWVEVFRKPTNKEKLRKLYSKRIPISSLSGSLVDLRKDKEAIHRIEEIVKPNTSTGYIIKEIASKKKIGETV